MSRRPKCWFYMDTESRVESDAIGGAQVWRLGVVAHDHRKDGPDRWREPELDAFDTPAELWAWVDARCRPGERAIFIAHNLAFDLRIAQAFTILPAMGWTMDRIRLDTEQTQVRWRDGKRTLLMIDSLAWLPAALAKIGEDIGTPKEPLPEPDAPADEWLARCMGDVQILRAAWRLVLDWVRVEDLGCWQSSGASQAWSAWRHRFMTDRVLVHDDDAVRALERRACWGGRAEAWKMGRHGDGPYSEFDFQCAYLAIARDVLLPARPVGVVDRPTLAEVLALTERAAVLTRCHVTTDVPIVPAELDGMIVWPTGDFDTVLWDCELRLAVENGATVEPIEAVVYHRRPILKAFAEWLWPMATGEAPDCDPIVHRVAKHWARAIVGRFGVRYREWVPFGEAHGPDVMLRHVADTVTGEHYRLISIGDRTLREGEVLEGENAVPAVMGAVMAELRCRLWRSMMVAGLVHVLHVDTDGLIVDQVGTARLLESPIEGLRVKGEYPSVEIFATRQLWLDGIVRATGVPRRAKRIGPRTFRGEVWPQLSTSLLAGEHDAVRVVPRTVTLLGTERRRVDHGDGTTGSVRLVAGERPAETEVAV